MRKAAKKSACGYRVDQPAVMRRVGDDYLSGTEPVWPEALVLETGVQPIKAHT